MLILTPTPPSLLPNALHLSLTLHPAHKHKLVFSIQQCKKDGWMYLLKGPVE